jgi:hypothetical protein
MIGEAKMTAFKLGDAVIQLTDHKAREPIVYIVTALEAGRIVAVYKASDPRLKYNSSNNFGRWPDNMFVHYEAPKVKTKLDLIYDKILYLEKKHDRNSYKEEDHVYF